MKKHKVDKRVYQSQAIKVREKTAFFAYFIDLFQFNTNNGDIIPFVIRRPNIIELFFNQSEVSKTRARRIWKSKIEPYLKQKRSKQLQDIHGDKSPIENELIYFVDHEKADKSIYDFIQECSTAVVFAYAGLEAASNRLIPDNFKDAKYKSKIDVERYADLSYKLKKIIPNVYSIQNPANQGFWNDFIKLEKARHSIIHSKSGDNYASLDDIVTLQSSVIAIINTRIFQSARTCFSFLADQLINNKLFREHHKLPFDIKYKKEVLDNFLQLLYGKPS